MLAEQQRVREAIAGVATPAPAALRARIQTLRPDRGRRARFAIAGALATAAAALILALALPTGTPAGPSLSQAATLSALPATAPAPEPYDGTNALLNVTIGGVRFPAWADAFGWKASGVRTDQVAGRAGRHRLLRQGGKADRLHDRRRATRSTSRTAQRRHSATGSSSTR